MNDDLREKLSAYLDGALASAERAAVEAQLAGSEDMRRELAALRAVSGAVKGLPKAKLPAGFMARLQARREKEQPSQRSWVFLPPAYRPVAFALSTAVVALVVWDKTRAPQEFAAPRSGWQGDIVAVKTAADAPSSQMDLSGNIASQKALSPASAPSAAAGAPIGASEEKLDSFTARNEEERSAINERLYGQLESEKKRMGIVRLLDKETEPAAARMVSRRAALSSVRGAGRASAPAPKILILKNAESLQAAWTAAGLSGEPPAVKFSEQMALFLACPPGCGIVSVRTSKKRLTVLYKDSGFEDSSARARAVPFSDKPAVLRLAP